jgi:hypothetical protein
MYRLVLLFFILYCLNQFSFIFYNYSWFSLLCSTYVIDFYNLFYFLTVDLFFFNLINDYLSLTSSELCTYVLDRCSLDLFFYNFFIDFSDYISFFFHTITFETENIYCLYFDTKVIGNGNVYFYILQNKLFILPGETTLSFFRIYNDNAFAISGVTIYSITPFEVQSFLNKIQCFCFEEIVVHRFEIIELPVLFYLDTNISYLNTLQLKEFCIEYVLLCSKVA